MRSRLHLGSAPIETSLALANALIVLMGLILFAALLSVAVLILRRRRESTSRKQGHRSGIRPVWPLRRK